MERIINQGIYIFVAVLGLLLLYLLAPILTPFLLGALIAYLADPLVRKLDRYQKTPHVVNVTLVFMLIIVIFAALLLTLIPLIQSQVVEFIDALPGIASWLQYTFLPRLNEYINVGTLKQTLSAGAANAAKTGWILDTVLYSGYTLIQWLVYLILTPVVTFYLLRDWDKILDRLKNLLPRSIKPTVIKIARECDEVLGAFFRGQLIVMLCLCVIYGVGLTLTGLRVGLVIGIVGGLLSIVPYLGSTFVVVTAAITTVVQFGTWQSLIGVFVVFLIGQALEGYVLTPNLVGNRIGLHPVAVIFAVMAGGSLFGFFGVLLALPVAAVIMVLVRHLNNRYHASKFYNDAPSR